MSSTPASPTRRRRSIRLSTFETPEDALPSPYTSGFTNGTTFSRRSSRTSQSSFHQSPTTPRPASARSSRPSSLYHRRKSSSRLSIGSNLSLDADENGLGNLADELEDALEDEFEAQGDDYLDGTEESNLDAGRPASQTTSRDDGAYDKENLPHPMSPSKSSLLSPSKSKSEKRKSRHQRVESRYDGSDYGPESDPDEDGITPALAKKMRDVESIARMSVNTEDMLSEGGGVIKRTTQALKEVSPQASLETSVARVIAAYTSMATHRTHKTRDLFSQAHSLLYGNVLELPENVIDSLLLELSNLASTVGIAQPQNPLASLQMLASQTVDLAHTLRSLSDVLQESRIQANTATRKLKSVKDMVEDICMEQELAETSMMLIQAGDWDRRCRERQAAATCREVIRGFGDRWGLDVDDRPWTREHKGMVT